MKKIVSALTILAALALSSGFASAQTLTYDGELANATSINPTLGYSLYGFNSKATEISNFPSFVNGETISSGYYLQNATTLTVAGTYYSKTGQLSGSGVVTTLTLDNTIPSSFVLGSLTDNQGKAGVGSASQVTVDLYNAGGTLLSSVVEGVSAQPGTTQNDIYYATVSGAQDGDYLTFSVMSKNYPAFAGITFDSADPLVVPEPKTWALLFGGVAFLGFMMVRRRQQV